MGHSVSIRSPAEGLRGCSQVWALMTKLLQTLVHRLLCGCTSSAPLAKRQGTQFWTDDMVRRWLLLSETVGSSPGVPHRLHPPARGESSLLRASPASVLWGFDRPNRCAWQRVPLYTLLTPCEAEPPPYAPLPPVCPLC